MGQSASEGKIMTLAEVAKDLGVTRQQVWLYYKDNVRGFKECCWQLFPNGKIFVDEAKYREWLKKIGKESD